MESASYLTIGSLADNRARMDEYHPRLESLPINTLDTAFVRPTIPEAVQDTQQVMKENGWSQAFVRSVYKSAPKRLQQGSFINSTDEKEIRQTLRSLQVQLKDSPWRVGSNFVIRERLNLSYCMNPTHAMCHPEIRFFVEGGEVLGITPDTCSAEMVCSDGYGHLETVIRDASPPVGQAQVVADEFQEYPWCVDFILTEQGDWYCVELNFNGVRKHDGRWVNLCGHAEKEPFGPAIIHEPALRQIEDMSQ